MDELLPYNLGLRKTTTMMSQNSGEITENIDKLDESFKNNFCM